MKRINIYDSIYRDARFHKLSAAVGKYAAIGMLVEAWDLAYTYRTKTPHKHVPLDKWPDELKPVIDVGLASISEYGIYVKGSDEELSFLDKMVKGASAGGKASAEQRRMKSLENISTLSKGFQVSYSYSNSLIHENKKHTRFARESDAQSLVVSETKEIQPTDDELWDEVEKAQPKKNIRDFIAMYVRGYQSRFPGQRPADLYDPKVLGQIKNLLKTFPIAKASDLVQAYFQIDDPWFQKKGYSFLTFRENLNKIDQALASGSPTNAATNWAKIFGGKK
jgi:hypothetical protein